MPCIKINRLLFTKGSFETIRHRLNADKGIPLEGRNGFRDGVEVTDGTGKTMEHVLPVYNETLDKDIVLEIDGLPDYVANTSVENMTEDEYHTACPCTTDVNF